VDPGYQPKYPRAKLRDIVTKHLGALRLAGLKPNCTVVFGQPQAQAGEVRGWLMQDPRQRVAEVRYLLLDDGDVWREVEAPHDAGATADRLWLSGPDDDLVTLLVQARNDAQRGGKASLVPEERVDLATRVVADRREARQPHDGPERRGS
jgi:hypothetical protein